MVQVCDSNRSMKMILLCRQGDVSPTVTWGKFEVNAVAVVRVATVVVDQALCIPTVDWLSNGLKVFLWDAPTGVHLFAIDKCCGGHAGSICLTPVASLLTLGNGAVTPQSCRDTTNRDISTVLTISYLHILKH